MQWQKWINTTRHNFWAPFFSRESVSGVLLYLPIHMVAPREVFSSPALSPPRVPKAWRRTFSDTDRAQDIYKSQQSRAVKWEHLHNNNKKIKKKVTVRNQPVRKQLWGEELPGKHRETCLHGAEVWLQRTESAERCLHQAQKGDQSQASGVRAELEPESRRRWLGVRCQHRQQAQAAQHETLPSFEHSHNALTDSHSWEMQRRGFVSAAGSGYTKTLSSQSCHKVLEGPVMGEVERCALCAPFSSPAQGTLTFIALGTNISKTMPISASSCSWQAEDDDSIKN